MSREKNIPGNSYWGNTHQGCQQSGKNEVLDDRPPPIKDTERDLTMMERATLAQLRFGYCKLLCSKSVGSRKMLASTHAPTVSMYSIMSSISSFFGLIRCYWHRRIYGTANARNPGNQISLRRENQTEVN